MKNKIARSMYGTLGVGGCIRNLTPVPLEPVHTSLDATRRWFDRNWKTKTKQKTLDTNQKRFGKKSKPRQKSRKGKKRHDETKKDNSRTMIRWYTYIPWYRIVEKKLDEKQGQSKMGTSTPLYHQYTRNFNFPLLWKSAWDLATRFYPRLLRYYYEWRYRIS